MFFILGLAAAVLAVAVVVGQVKGHNPAFCRGAVGWVLSAGMFSGAVGLVVLGQFQEVAGRRAQEQADAEVVAEMKKAAAELGISPEAAGQAQLGTPKPGGPKGSRGAKGGKRGGKKGSKKGSKKGGKKKGGWGRRSFGPTVPLTPERRKRFEDLRKAGVMFQARGGQVTQLQLSGLEVSGKHLGLLDGLSGARSLVLSAPNVSGAALAPLATMTGLTELDLTGTSVNDESLRYLSDMTKLSTLTLCNQPITDDGAIVLAKLTALKTLDLTNTGLTDKGVARLAGLKSLTRLVLSGTKVGDDGVGALVGITGMKQLELSHTRVGDGVVDHLLKFRNAELFWLTRGPEGVSDKAIDRIRIDLRTCVVRYSAVELPKRRPAGGGE